MAGKYDWRPSAGVRSVAEVFNLIVNENRMLNNLLSGAPNPALTVNRLDAARSKDTCRPSA